MSQRAALYTVTVRGRRGGARPLGDVDGNGASLAAFLEVELPLLSETSADGARLVRVLSVRRMGDAVFAMLEHGQRGVAADIVGPDGSVRLRQAPSDLQLLRCGCLFRAPAAADEGLLAVHVANGRGTKELFEQGLRLRFHRRFPGARLVLDRYVQTAALQQAVAAGRVVGVELVRREPAGSHAIPEASQWLEDGDAARIGLAVAPSPGRGGLRTGLIERYLSGDAAALGEILRFAGLDFDDARISVVLPGGVRRGFDLARPAAARPLLRDLEGIALDADGEPTSDSLLAALQAALGSAEPSARGGRDG